MSDAIFIVNKVSGDLTIGDKHEIDKATWRKPRGTRLTPTSRYIRDMLFSACWATVTRGRSRCRMRFRRKSSGDRLASVAAALMAAFFNKVLLFGVPR